MMEDSTKDGEELLVSLRRLLEEQQAAAREGNLSRVEQLGELTDAVVAQIAPRADFLLDARTAQRGDLERLYRELLMVLEAQQADVRDKLRQVRQVKRAVGAYAGKRK
jgi:hypothetical protein